ncbi:hypothetical protein WA026_002611 [Henosepilachna vigintioctopunctata]
MLHDFENNEIENELDLNELSHNFSREPNEESGRNVELWDENSGVNPEELGNYLEGDIMMTPRMAKNGLSDKDMLWKNGIIPYEISGHFTTADVDLIKRAMGVYHKYTCIRFVPRKSSDKDYISIQSGYTGCWSSVGRMTGRQEVNLQTPSCTRKLGTVLHELMHVCGFYHEQNRPERDFYVTVYFQNIKSGHQRNFEKASLKETNDFGVPYDYRSVMHYSGNAFSRNGNPTIVPKDPKGEGKIGQREGFSKGDLLKLNAMYKCPNTLPGKYSILDQENHFGGESNFITTLLNKFDYNHL